MSARLPIRAMLFGAAALTLGAGTLVLSQGRAVVGQRRVGPDAAPLRMTKILVAVRALPAGVSVKAGDLAWRDWPQAALDPAYIIGPAAHGNFIGSIIRAPVESGEPMTAERVVAAGSRGALAAITAPGSRAVSISLTPTSGVSGLIVPGDHVDVILTYALPRGGDASGPAMERRAAATILSGLRVLAVDQRLTGAPTDAKEIHNVSLEVTVKQSEVLALASDLGKLSLSLQGLATAADDHAVTANSSTLDYQVGRYLPPLRQATVRPHQREQGRATNSSAIEFHGGKRNGAAPIQ